MTTFAVHYMKPEFTRDGMMGVKWLKEHGPMPSLGALDKTHIELKTFELDRPLDFDVAMERIFVAMQGENWSPNGEARPLIRSKGLEHTSMSVGDVIVVNGGRLYIAERFGFTLIEEEPLDTDGDTSRWNENGEGSERDNDRYAARANPEEN